MGYTNDVNVMPTGAELPEVEATEVETTEVEPILGKFKSHDDLVTAYQELEKKIGEQGNELGAAKQMNAMMLDKISARQAQDNTPATEVEKDTFDYDVQMDALTKGVDSGEIPYDQALKMAANLAAETATRKSLSQYEKLTAQRQIEDTKNKFLTDNPDFKELQASGKLDSVKKTLPGMHDDFSAYYAYKADEARAFALAKSETDRIAGGDKRTAMVLNKPGAKTNEIGKPAVKLTPAQLKQQTLAKLEEID